MLLFLSCGALVRLNSLPHSGMKSINHPEKVKGKVNCNKNVINAAIMLSAFVSLAIPMHRQRVVSKFLPITSVDAALTQNSGKKITADATLMRVRNCQLGLPFDHVLMLAAGIRSVKAGGGGHQNRPQAITARLD
jgi:hypothetical protein